MKEKEMSHFQNSSMVRNGATAHHKYWLKRGALKLAEMKFKIASLFIVALSILMTGAIAAAGNWKIIDEDSWCHDRWYNNGKQVCETRELDIEKAWELINVDASPNGGIRVEGWKSKNIRLRARVQARAESEEAAREILSNVEIEAKNNTIRTRGPEHFHSKKSWSVSFSLMVPENSDLDLNTLNGGISIQNVHGEIDAETLNGGIKLAMISGDARIRATNGGIIAALDGERWQGEGLDLHTTNGAIRLSIPDDYSAELRAGTVNGAMKIDFPVTVQGRISKSISTTLGKGGPAIRAETTNGSINIEKE